jgi:hypothetical protein
MHETPKHIKRALRELAGRAYEIELGRALTALQGEFARWERGEITAFDLEAAIHRFHQGSARDLYLIYANRQSKMAVAYAIDAGILDRAEVAADVLEHLSAALEFYEGQRSNR